VRILVLSNLYPPDVLGGYEIACAQAVDALRARGHEVLVAAGAPRNPTPTARGVRRVFKLVDEWNATEMSEDALVIALRSAESRIVSAHNVHVLTAILAEFDPDVVLVSNILGLGGLGLMTCLQYLKTPWVWHLGDCVPRLLCSKFHIFDRANPALAEEFSRHIQGHFVLVSQQLRDEVESAGIRLNGDVAVIPYWIAGTRPPGPSLQERRAGDGVLRIISAGQVSREKGIDLLIEAAGELKGGGCGRFVLDIYGQVDGPFFEHRIRELGLDEQVRLRGARPHHEILELYGRYHVFAFPSRDREPFGLVPLEAAARGCVPIITRRCGIAEWLVHGVHCLKVKRTAGSFAEAFRAIMAGEVALEPLARRAEAAAWRDFHIDAILPRIEAKLARAAQQPRASAGNAADAYRLARLAEQLTQTLIQESLSA
jgi:glycosyltransferase involved in cell wall biosynthesis